MTIQDAVTALRRFNIWRRYDGPAGCAPKMPDMKIIGEAVDMVCDYVDHRLATPKYFTLEELLKSQKALDNKIPNLPSWEIVENLRETAFDLDQIRDFLEFVRSVRRHHSQYIAHILRDIALAHHHIPILFQMPDDIIGNIVLC